MGRCLCVIGWFGDWWLDGWCSCAVLAVVGRAGGWSRGSQGHQGRGASRTGTLELRFERTICFRGVFRVYGGCGYDGYAFICEYESGGLLSWSLYANSDLIVMGWLYSSQ